MVDTGQGWQYTMHMLRDWPEALLGAHSMHYLPEALVLDLNDRAHMLYDFGHEVDEVSDSMLSYDVNQVCSENGYVLTPNQFKLAKQALELLFIQQHGKL